jgi:hypothetical protein
LAYQYSPLFTEIHPDVEALVIGNRGTKLLIFSLLETGISLEEAVQIFCVDSEELDLFGRARWLDVPPPLRLWLQEQDGLKIDGKAIKSEDDLLRVHMLLHRKPSNLAKALEVGIMGICLDVAVRYFKQIETFRPESPLEGLVFSRREPMPRKCGVCGSRILDDPYPRFKRLDPNRYVVRYLKKGCGAIECHADSDTAWALPFQDNILWTVPSADKLRRPPKKAEWTGIFLRSEEEVAELPATVATVCRSCRGQDGKAKQDLEPQWTIETPSQYVTRSLCCQFCEKKTKWSSVDVSIVDIDPAALTKSWKRFNEG